MHRQSILRIYIGPKSSKKGKDVMIACSFIGNCEVYDRNLYLKLKTVIKQLAEENDKIKILLCFQYGDFFKLCLQTVLEIRAYYPQKVTVLFVADANDQANPFIAREMAAIPFNMDDNIITIHFPDIKGQDFYTRNLSLQRWVIQNSTHVISSVYQKFCEPENHLIYFAQKIDTLNIIDLSNAKIIRVIDTYVKTLTDREQLIIQKLEEGFTLKEVGELLGISAERVRQIQAKAGTKLRKLAANELSEMDLE